MLLFCWKSSSLNSEMITLWKPLEGQIQSASVFFFSECCRYKRKTSAEIEYLHSCTFDKIESNGKSVMGKFPSSSCHKDLSCLFVGAFLFFFLFFAHSSISPAQKIRLYRAQAVKLVLDRCIAYAPQGQMGLEKRVCELESERNKIAKREVSAWADGWVTQCPNIPGRCWGARRWLPACNNCSHISHSHISCFSEWMMKNTSLF